MGVLPLQYKPGDTRESLNITGHEIFDFPDLTDSLKPLQEMRIILTDPNTKQSRPITVICRIDSRVEVDYYRNGGILPAVLRKLVAS